MAEPQHTTAVTEADDLDNDADSGLGVETLASSTTSISSSIMKYREENGRTYHAYKDGAYAFPNDDPERERLDLQHAQFTLTFDGKLFTAPIPKEKTLHRVLDVGTGTGIWAIDFADDHPASEVFGIDLSPIQPTFTPPNLKFQVDDLESEWTFAKKFDFIHSRMMIGSFVNVPKFIERCFQNLTPGGYLEMTDICFPIKLNEGPFPEGSALYQWSTLFMQASEIAGRKSNCASFYKQQIIDAGFENVVETKYIWPSNRWPKDKKLKELGIWQFENLGGGLDAISAALFTRVLNWSKPELDVFLANVRNELKDTRVHSYWDIYCVYGNKPA